MYQFVTSSKVKWKFECRVNKNFFCIQIGANPIFKQLEGVEKIRNCKWEIRGRSKG